MKKKITRKSKNELITELRHSSSKAEAYSIQLDVHRHQLTHEEIMEVLEVYKEVYKKLV